MNAYRAAHDFGSRHCLLAIHLAEHFQFDQSAVIDFVSREGRAAIADFVRREMGDDDGEPAAASDESDRDATA